MNTNDLATLCRACGMCCDGSLFGRARLDADEVALAKKHHLRLAPNEGSFEQRCTALVEDACAIYEERPRACRAFVCRLFERVRTGGDVLEGALLRVRRARELLAHLDASGASDARDPDPDLATLMDEDFARG